jgi:hypothetical protein
VALRPIGLEAALTLRPNEDSFELAIAETVTATREQSLGAV